MKNNNKLGTELEKIAEEERALATRRQKRAGITEPVRTRFRTVDELPPRLNAALNRIWVDGDQNLRTLYCQIGKGLACMTEADVISLAKEPPDEMRRLAGWLVQGKTLAEARKMI